MDPDRRVTPRLSLHGTLAGELSVLAPVSIREIGPSGVRLDSAYPLLVDSVHDLRLHLEDDVIVVKGRVVHCQIANIGKDAVIYRAGLEFIDVPPHTKAAIDAYVLGLQYER